MTNEIISQKLDCIWHNLRRLLQEMNLEIVEEWPDEPPAVEASDTKELQSDAEEL